MAENKDMPDSGEISFENSMREALTHLDNLQASLNDEKNKAIEDQIAAQQKLKQIIQDAENEATYAFHSKHSELEKQLRSEISKDYVMKLILAGIPSFQLKKILEISSELLADAWMDLNFVPLDEYHIAMVRYEENGRSGNVIFYGEDRVVKFWYEFGGGDTLVYVNIPNADTWTTTTGFPVEQRNQILEFVAKDIIRVKAKGYQYEIGDTSIRIFK